MQLGKLEILSAYDGQIVFDTPAGVPPRDSAAFEPHRNYIDEDGHFLMDIGAFIVRSGDRVLLLDAGAGPAAPCCAMHARHGDAKDPALISFYRDMGLSGPALDSAVGLAARSSMRTGLLGESLAALGIAPGEITDVLLSHLHFDHIGWASKDGKPYFPNATYRCERRDAAFFLGKTAHDEAFARIAWQTMPATERLAPVLERLELWDGDAVIAPGVQACYAPGHTPGNSIFVLSSGEARAMILGDAVHCPLELTDPEFSLMSDLDKALADRTRAQIRQEIEGGEVLVSAPHFRELQFGRMLPGKGRPFWNFGV